MNGSNGPKGGLPLAGALPSPAGSPRYHILRAKPGAPVRVLCCNPTLYGAKVHFVEGRSQPCVADALGHCDHCLEQRPRWYGFMGGLVPEAGRLALAEVTFEAADKCPLLHQEGVNLRGLLLKVERIGSSKRGRCYVTFEEVRVKVKLPPPINIPAALCAVWGVTTSVAGFQVQYASEGGEA